MSDVTGQKERLRLIRDHHVIRPGHPGLECLGVPESPQVFLTVGPEGWVMCPACGNELGHQSQLMIQVWDDSPELDWYSKRRCTAHLEFVGAVSVGAGPSGPKAP